MNRWTKEALATVEAVVEAVAVVVVEEVQIVPMVEVKRHRSLVEKMDPTTFNLLILAI